MSQTKEINGFYATSFEEAFILTNFDNNILNDSLKSCKPKVYNDLTNQGISLEKNKEYSYKWQTTLEKTKTFFANSLLFNIVNATENEHIPELPGYIKDAFEFLEKELRGEMIVEI